MLVLTRKSLETIKIGNDIVIQVICTGTRSVRIGIEAPKSVRILRGELDELESTGYHMVAEGEAPIVADASTDVMASEPVVVGPMTTEKFLADFDDELLPGRSIRRMLNAQRHALSTVAK